MFAHRRYVFCLLAISISISLGQGLPVAAQEWMVGSGSTQWVASLPSEPASVMVSRDRPAEEMPDASTDNDSLSVEDDTLAPLVEGVEYVDGQANYHVAHHSGYSPYSPRFCRPTRVYRSFFLGRLWYNAELLGWATKGQDLPALVTNSPAAGATTLFGDERVHDEMRLGGRITGGWWWTPEQRSGLELQYFGVDGEDVDFRAGNGTDPVVARPFIDAATGLPVAAAVNSPGVAVGGIRVRADMEFTGAGAHLRHRLAVGHSYRIDWLFGYRYLRLYDQLRTLENFTSLSPASGFAAGLDVERFDRFRTENEFHGGELGLIAQWRRRCWSVDILGKAAYGSTHEGIFIEGQTTTTDAVGNSTIYSGGLLAQDSNSGSVTNSRDSFVGELGISLKYHLSCQTRLAIGYTAIYWADVARSADQIDLTVAPAQIPPAGGVGGRPLLPLAETEFWAHGLNASFEYQF